MKVPQKLLALEIASIGAMAALILAPLIFTFKHLHRITGVGADEWGFLAGMDSSVGYRFVAHFAEFANFLDYPKSVPIASWFRPGFFRVLGLDANFARASSVFEFCVVGGLLALVVYRVSRRKWLAGLAFFLFLTFPNIFLVATTVRSEQDVWFFGALSLACLFDLRTGPKAARWLLLSGLMAGAAAASHPVGILFGVGALLSLAIWIYYRRLAWKISLLWGVGFAVPFLATLAYYFGDWENSLQYINRMVEHSVHYNPLRTGKYAQAFEAATGIPLPAKLENLGGALYVNYGGLYALGDATYVQAFVRLLQILLAGGFFFCGVSFLRSPRNLPDHLLLPMSVWIGAALMMIVYPPNSDYTSYFNGVGWLTLILFAVHGIARASRKWQRCLLLGMMSVLAIFQGTYLVAMKDRFGRSYSKSFEAQKSGMRAMSLALGLRDEDPGRILTDPSSWPAGGLRARPLQEFLGEQLEKAPGASSAIVFAPRSCTLGEPIASKPERIPQQKKRFHAVTADMSLQGIALWEGEATRYWLAPTKGQTPRFLWVDTRGNLIWLTLEKKRTINWDLPKGKTKRTLDLDLPKGRFAILVRGEAISTSRSELQSSPLHRSFVEDRLQNFPHAAAGALVVLESHGGKAEILSELILEKAGQAQFVVWELRPLGG